MSPKSKIIVVACALMGLSVPAYAEGQFWVAGNRETRSCEIVTSNPVLEPVSGFASGPYKSLDDAKLARAGISACPKVDDSRSSPK